MWQVFAFAKGHARPRCAVHAWSSCSSRALPQSLVLRRSPCSLSPFVLSLSLMFVIFIFISLLISLSGGIACAEMMTQPYFLVLFK